MSNSLALIAYASGLGANNLGCGNGPIQLKKHAIEDFLLLKGLKSHWCKILKSQNGLKKSRLIQITELNKQLAEITCKLTRQNQNFVVIGGDHSSAIGTWSGVAVAKKNIGLIWIDAHMDSHTFDTTPSGNIHGMPLAALLGYGDSALTHLLTEQSKLNAQHVVLIGIRSFEEQEAALLKKLHVSIYDMHDIKEKGLMKIMQNAITYLKNNTIGFGVSLDLDAIDPHDAPGVGLPVTGGIHGEDLCQALNLLNHENQLLGLEIAEYNPYLDVSHKTEYLIQRIILSVFGD